MKFKIFEFKNVTSTNDLAINLIKKGNRKIGCVFAKKQTKGRGTFGKRWISDEGNLFISLFFPLKKKYPNFAEFSIINPIIISNVIKTLCKKSKVNLKFPNDVFLNGKKICGLLQEIITLEKNKFLIIGIGINLISNPNIKRKYKATNIFLETKEKVKTKKIINLIINSYENFFHNIKSYNYLNFKRKAESLALN